jgi:hypothetical protein
MSANDELLDPPLLELLQRGAPTFGGRSLPGGRLLSRAWRGGARAQCASWTGAVADSGVARE